MTVLYRMMQKIGWLPLLPIGLYRDVGLIPSIVERQWHSLDPEREFLRTF